MIVVRRAVQRDPDRFQQELEQIFRDALPARPRVSPRPNNLWRPPVEVIETEDGLAVTVEIAGMDESQLQVVIDGDRLSVRGDRPGPTYPERRQYHEARIPYGAFGADVFLPIAVDPEQSEATYENGFLRIVLPRQQARTIVPRRPTDDRA